ncbi:unnamed protein product, partial [Linum tenue]
GVYLDRVTGVLQNFQLSRGVNRQRSLILKQRSISGSNPNGVARGIVNGRVKPYPQVAPVHEPHHEAAIGGNQIIRGIQGVPLVERVRCCCRQRMELRDCDNDCENGGCRGVDHGEE